MHEMRLKECKVIYYPLSNNCFLLFSYSSMFVHFFSFILVLMRICGQSIHTAQRGDPSIRDSEASCEMVFTLIIQLRNQSQSQISYVHQIFSKYSFLICGWWRFKIETESFAFYKSHRKSLEGALSKMQNALGKDRYNLYGWQ